MKERSLLLIEALRLNGVHDVFLELRPAVHLDEGSAQVHIIRVSFLHNQAMLLDILAHGEEVVGIQGQDLGWHPCYKRILNGLPENHTVLREIVSVVQLIDFEEF